ncbi:hypothetical protein ACHAQA_004785 [Verticillium albo-atrum]
MHALTLTLLALPLLTLAQDRPACVSTCIENNLMSSQCDGDESGAALDRCTCNTLNGSNMVACINECTPADQASYAANVPELCRDTLFPNADDSGSGSNDDTTSAAATATAETTAATTAATSTDSEAATATDEAAGETQTPDAAVGREVPVFLAAGLFAALLL